MKKRTRVKLFAWFAVVTLVAAACGGDGSDTGAEDGTTATSAADTQASGELVVWHYFKTPGQVETLEAMADLFNAEFPNVEVVYEEQPFDQMTPNLLAASATSSGPDVVIYQWGDVLKLVEANALTSMEPFFSASDEASLFPESVVHRVTGTEYDPDGGDVFTIQPYVNLIGLFYNKEILESAGIEPPTTFDELTAALETVTAAGQRGLVFDATPGVGGWWGGMPWMWANGVDINMSDEAAIEEVFTLVRSYVEDGYVPPDVVTYDQQTAMVQWLTGDFAFTVNGNWELTRVADEATFEWGVVQMPAGPAGSSVYLGGEGVAIGAFTEQADLAWEYLTSTWLSAPGQLSLVDSIGSIPVRGDVADDDSITSAPGLPAFLASVPTGERLPITQQENEAQTLFGDTWSAVVSGQLSPADGAATVVTDTPGILGG